MGLIPISGFCKQNLGRVCFTETAFVFFLMEYGIKTRFPRGHESCFFVALNSFDKCKNHAMIIVIKHKIQMDI